MELVVTNYFLRPDGDSRSVYDHIYHIELSIETHKVRLDRSYGSLIALHSHLKSVYPNTQLPGFPLTYDPSLVNPYYLKGNSSSSSLSSSNDINVSDSLASTKAILSAIESFELESSKSTSSNSNTNTNIDTKFKPNTCKRKQMKD